MGVVQPHTLDTFVYVRVVLQHHDVTWHEPLVEDIGQRNNLAAEHPERVAELQNLLKQIREQGYSAPRLAK